MHRSFYCFKNTKNKYYGDLGEIKFSPWHSGQWCIFLYYLSNCLSSQHSDTASKVYYLNKMLNNVDLYHEVELPIVFSLDHPLGSVLGRAIYGNYFSFSQGCTVGNNKGIYPTIGTNVRMLSNSKIIGRSKIGDNAVISANCYIKDIDVPSDTIVFGQSPNLTFRKYT